MFLRIFYKIQEALIYYHKYSLHGTGFQDFFQKVLRYGDPCRIIGITQENNIRLFSFQNIRIIFLYTEIIFLFQIISADLTANTDQCLFILRKGRSRKKGLLWIQCPAEGKNKVCGSIPADQIFFFCMFIICDCLFQRSASYTGIITQVLYTVYDRLLYTLRCSQRITVCREIQTVIIFINITAMYMFCHQLSPVLLYMFYINNYSAIHVTGIIKRNNIAPRFRSEEISQPPGSLLHKAGDWNV